MNNNTEVQKKTRGQMSKEAHELRRKLLEFTCEELLKAEYREVPLLQAKK